MWPRFQQLDCRTVAGRVPDLRDRVARRLAVTPDHMAAQANLLQPETASRRKQFADHPRTLRQGKIHWRPDVKQHAVPEESFTDRPLCLKHADPGQRLLEHVLKIRQCRQVTVFVIHRRQVADLGDGEQALITRILFGRRAEQVHILDGG